MGRCLKICCALWIELITIRKYFFKVVLLLNMPKTTQDQTLEAWTNNDYWVMLSHVELNFLLVSLRPLTCWLWWLQRTPQLVTQWITMTFLGMCHCMFSCLCKQIRENRQNVSSVVSSVGWKLYMIHHWPEYLHCCCFVLFVVLLEILPHTGHMLCHLYSDGRGDVEELEGVEGGEAVIRIYYVKRRFSIKRKTL